MRGVCMAHAWRVHGLTLALSLTLTLTQDFNGRVRKISVKNFILEDAAKPGRYPYPYPNPNPNPNLEDAAKPGRWPSRAWLGLGLTNPNPKPNPNTLT